jgi:hypothetical protein
MFKIYLREMRCEDVDWIELAHYRAQMTGIFKNGDEILGSLEGGEFPDQLSIYPL